MEEILFWNRLNSVMSGFCVDNLKTANMKYKDFIDTIVGIDLDWCNSEALISMTSVHELLKVKIPELEKALRESEKSLNIEKEASNSLRKQIKLLHVSAEDTTWELQEQLAHATNTLQQERDHSLELKNQLEVTQNKLVEVESFLSSNKGNLLIQLEEELASAKLKIAELEEEKDHLEIHMRKKLNSENKNNAFKITSANVTSIKEPLKSISANKENQKNQF